MSASVVGSGDCFEDQEAELLTWLLEMPEISEAVQLAWEGRLNDAEPILVQTVRRLLQDEGKEAEEVVQSGADGAPARKRRRHAPPLTPGFPRCLCLVLSGLQGSGKSTLCKMLREALGGNWLDHDAFAAKRRVNQPPAGQHLREDFAKELRAMLTKSLASADSDAKERLVLVDRANTSRSDRNDILQELRSVEWQSKGGKIVLVELRHTADAFGQGADGLIAKRIGEKHIALCAERADGQSPQLRSSIENAAKALEPPLQQELSQMDGCISVDLAKPPTEMALYLIEELQRLRLLDRSHYSIPQLQSKLDVAWQANQKQKGKLRAAFSKEEPQQEWLDRSRQALDEEKARAEERTRQAQAEAAAAPSASPVPLYWKIDLPQVSKFLQKKMLPAGLVPVEQHHVTLLYLGGDGNDTQKAQRAGLSAEEFVGMRDALEALQNEEFEVSITEIVMDENVACAVVTLPGHLPCMNKVPHVTLGMRPGVPARHANEVLQELKDGRKEGMNCVKLPKPRPFKGRLALEVSTTSSVADA